MASSGNVSGSFCQGHYLFKINWQQQKDIKNNRSKIKFNVYFIHEWSLDIGPRNHKVEINGTTFNFSSRTIDRNSGSYLLKTGELWVKHNSDGTKTININGGFSFLASIGSGCGYKNTITANENITLDPIPRKSIIRNISSSYNVNDNFTFDCDRKYSGYKQRWKAYVGDFKFYEYITTSTSYDSSILKNPYDVVRRVTNAKTCKIKIVLDTLNGDNLIGTDTKYFTLNIGDLYPPIVSDLTIKENNLSVKALNLGYGKFIKGFSRISYTANVSAKYNATIISRPPHYQYDWVIEKFIGNKTLTWIDSRGVSVSKSVSIEVYDYFTPKIIEVTHSRWSNDNKLKINLKIKCFEIGDKNKYSVKIYRKETGESSWQHMKTYSDLNGYKNLMIKNDIQSFIFEVTKTYDVRIRVEDRLNWTESTFSIATPDMIMSLGKNGVSFGKVMYPSDYDGVIMYKKLQAHKPFYMHDNPITMLPEPMYDDHAVNKKYVDRRITSSSTDYTSNKTDNVYMNAIKDNWDDFPVGISIHSIRAGTMGIAIIYKYTNNRHGFVFSFGYNTKPKLHTRQYNGNWVETL